MVSYRAKNYLLYASLVELNALLATIATPSFASGLLFILNFFSFSLLCQLSLALEQGTYLIDEQLAYRHSNNVMLVLRSTVVLSVLAFFIVSVTLMKSQLPGTIGNYSALTLLAISLLATLPSFWLNLKIRHPLSHNTTKGSLLHNDLRHHFLFNSLNTTACLIPAQPKIAQANLINLAHLFRRILEQKSMTTLEQEIDTVKHYIQVERIRLGNRLGVEWVIPDAQALQTSIPTMILQPLIENAVYHGIETLVSGGIIHIRIVADPRSLFFEIRNPVNGGTPRVSRGTHRAINIIRARLESSYSTKHEFFFDGDNGEYVVHFRIPRKET